MNRAAQAATLVTLALGVLTAPAGAYYGNGAQVVSASETRHEQADGGTQFATISPDGRYVAFQTRALNFFADDDPEPPGSYRQGGIFRKDLETGALELVAYGSQLQEGTNATLVRGAQNPSISADGRYVAFSTAYSLVPADTNKNVDVYVRDMNKPNGSPDAYELVSAKDGGDSPAAYSASTAGAEVSAGQALSADAQKVVFRTNSKSNLPNQSAAETPPQELFVRDRAAKTTTLETRTATDGSPPVPGGVSAAGISADGTTVVWSGSNAASQTRFLTGENPDSSLSYYLWKRIADGPAAPTRRITGFVDPDDPECPPDAQVVQDVFTVGPCYGPLANPESSVTGNVSGMMPSISADGWRVAFLTIASPRPNGFGIRSDLYLTDMHPGVSRKAGTIELTREGSLSDTLSSGEISSVGMSANGKRLVFTSARTSFILPSPRLIDDPPATADVVELYAIDLDRMEIERVTRGFDGSVANHDTANGPTLSGDGRRIAFVSAATNLFVGDANEAQDAFVATEQPEVTPAQSTEPPFDQPPFPSRMRVDGVPPEPQLGIRVTRARAGVRLTIRTPGPGVVNALARSRLGGRNAAGAPLRTVARARAHVAVRHVTLTLRPARRYLALLRHNRRLNTRLLVRFSPDTEGHALTAQRTVAFTR